MILGLCLSVRAAMVRSRLMRLNAFATIFCTYGSQVSLESKRTPRKSACPTVDICSLNTCKVGPPGISSLCLGHLVSNKSFDLAGWRVTCHLSHYISSLFSSVCIIFIASTTLVFVVQSPASSAYCDALILVRSRFVVRSLT